MSVSVSVVISTKDREEELLKCIQSIAKQTIKPAEVLIIDDGNIPESVKEIVKKHFFKKDIFLKYFKKDKPGLSESRNLGAEKAAGDIILFLDDDVILENDYIENLLKVWTERWNEKWLAGVSGIITNIKTPSFFGKIFTKFFCLYSSKPFTVLPWGFQTWGWEIKKEEQVDWLPGCNMSFRKEIFYNYKFKPLQPGRTGAEDVEFCLHIKNEDYYFVITPTAKLIHNQSLVGREDAFITGFKEGINRKIIFNMYAKKSIKNYFCFCVAAVGYALRLFITGHCSMGFGVVRGNLQKNNVNKNLYKKNRSDVRKKITFFIPNLEMGGAERVTVNIVNSLDKKPYNLSLILAQKTGVFVRELPEDVHIFNLGTYSYVKIFLKLTKYFREEQPDIFISVFPIFTVISILAKIFCGSKAKIIIVEHRVFSGTGIYAKTFLKRIFLTHVVPLFMRVLYPNSMAIVCVSNGVANDISKITGLKSKIETIYNPITYPGIYDLAKEPVDHPWILSKKIPVILAVGRLVEAKDYPNLLTAFSLIVSKKPAKLLILGDGGEKEKLKALANMLGIANKVDFLGFQKNPYKFMAKADIFVLSSIYEGFPTVVVEAMTCGAPVVSTDCQSGPNEIIKNGKNGLLVPVRDSRALADNIIRLLDNNSLREKFSEESKIRAEDFTINKEIKEYENLFEKVLKSK